MTSNQDNSANLGVETSVRGSVVDVQFADSLSPIYSLLRAGPDEKIAIEVLIRFDGRSDISQFETPQPERICDHRNGTERHSRACDHR